MRSLPLIIALTLAAAPAARAEEDYFAPAKTGKLECYNPDSQSKTCTSIGRYTWQPDGKIIAEWEEEIVGEPGITARSRGAVSIANNRVCSVISTTAEDDYVIRQEGKELGKKEAANYSATIISNLSELKGKTVCVSLSPYGEAYVLGVTINGYTPMASTKYMRWISPSDGYTVGGSVPHFDGKPPIEAGPMVKPGNETKA
jgi:hypothetical protein